MKRLIPSVLFIAALVGLLALCVLDTRDAAAAKYLTRWPHTFADADTAFTLPELQPVSFTADGIVPYFRTFTATGAYALPGLSHYEAIANGADAVFRFTGTALNASAPDSLRIDSLGDATKIFMFGY